MALHEMTLDLCKAAFAPETMTVRAGDSGETVRVSVRRNGKPADLSGCTARWMAAKPDRSYVEQEMECSGSTAEATIAPECFAVPGMLRTAYVCVRGADGSEESTLDVLVNVLPSAEGLSDGLSGPYVSAVEEFLANLSDTLGQISAATSAANGAAGTANQAAASADQAASAANQAATSANQASSLASNAAASAQGAASNAEAAANNAITIANSVAAGSAGSSEIARLKDNVSQLGHQVADLGDAYLWMDGTLYVPSSRVSSLSGGALALASGSASGSTLTLS